MGERLHTATFIWGMVLTIAGAAMAAAGFGWWEITGVNLAYLAPIVVILVGAVITVGAIQGRNRPTDSAR